MPTVYVGLGGNVNDPADAIRKALALIDERGLGRVTAVSSLWKTEPVGLLEQPWFVNAATEVETELPPDIFLAGLKAIERELGRKERRVKNGPRNIDLDLLLYDDLVRPAPDPVIPHPRMHQRRFVLAPLAEIAPHVVHPTRGRTVAGLLAVLDDPSQADKMGPVTEES